MKKNLNTVVTLVILSIFSAVFSQKQPKVGLVLSGGGAKGFAHIGVIKVLEKANVQIDYIGGTSMGAIVGALYAAGYSADEIEKKIRAINFDDLITDKVPRSDVPLFYKQYLSNQALFLPISKGKVTLPRGVSEGQNTQNYFTELFSVIDNTFSFKDLPIPFFCVATDIENGERVVLESGDLAKSVRASGAFPTLVNPIEIGGRLLVDGGVVDNFPVKELRKKGMDIIIGVDVQEGLQDRNNLNSALDVLNQIASFSAHDESENQKKDVDFYLKPSIKGFNVISFDKADEIIDNGIKEAQKFKNDFDSISKLQVHRRPIKKHRYDENKKFLIDQIELYGNEKYSYDYVVGTLGISLCDSVSYHQVSNKINRLTGTKNFSNIKYKLNPVDSSKRLVITLNELDDKAFLGLGVHYDQIFGLGVLTNYTHKRLLTRNDIFSLDVSFGDRVRYNLNYFVDNGYSLGLGFTSSLKSFDSSIKDLGVKVLEINRLNVSFLEIVNRFYIQTKFRKKYALNLGIDLRRLKATSETILHEGKPITYENSNYALTFANLKIDRFNKKIYPTKGIYFNAQMDWVFYSNRDKKVESIVNKYKFSPFTQLRGQFSSVNSFRKLSFQQTYEAGLSLLTIPGAGFAYKIGGYNKNMPNNFVTFYGWDTAEYLKNNYLKGTASLRYNWKGNHNMLLDMNVIKMGKNNLLEDKLLENIYSGYAVGYGYKSYIGPLELRASWTPDKKVSVLVNLGFWF